MVSLFALLSSDSCKWQKATSIDHMNIFIQEISFYIPEVIKNKTAAFHPKPIALKPFPSDKRMFSVRTIVEYIKRID